MRTRASLVAASVLMVIVVLLDHRSNLGAIVVLAFLAVAPGVALVRLLGFPAAGERVGTLVVILGVSFAVDALVAEAMVYARVWTPARGLLTLAAIVVGLAAVDYARPHRDATAR